MRRVGPYSGMLAVAKMDGRSREAKFLAAKRAELIAHVGGKPSATQLALIERAAWLSLHVVLLDAKTIGSGGFSERDTRQYLAWSNCLSRAMRALGLESRAAQSPTLPEYLAARAGKLGGAQLPDGAA